MIRVEITLIPHGDATKKESLATVDIANVGKVDGVGEHYEYLVAADRPEHSTLQTTFQHDRSQNVISLLFRAFGALVRLPGESGW